MQFDKDPESSEVVKVVVSETRKRVRMALRFGSSGGVIRVRFDEGVDRLLLYVRTGEQRKAEWMTQRRDLELKIVAWGRIGGGDRSELSRTRIRSGWWAEFYPDTTSSQGGRGTTRSIKGGAERATDQRAHELSSLKSRAHEFRKRGGAQEGFTEPDKETRVGSITLT